MMPYYHIKKYIVVQQSFEHHLEHQWINILYTYVKEPEKRISICKASLKSIWGLNSEHFIMALLKYLFFEIYLGIVISKKIRGFLKNTIISSTAEVQAHTYTFWLIDGKTLNI